MLTQPIKNYIYFVFRYEQYPSFISKGNNIHFYNAYASQ